MPLDNDGGTIDYVSEIDDDEELVSHMNGHSNTDIDDEYHDSGGEASPEVIRDKKSEKVMIEQYAAESIQDAFRRYQECKPYIKRKKISGTNKAVMNLAADTIKDGFKWLLSNKNNSHQSKHHTITIDGRSSGSARNKLEIEITDLDDDICTNFNKIPLVASPKTPVPPLLLSPYYSNIPSNVDNSRVSNSKQSKSFKDYCSDEEEIEELIIIHDDSAQVEADSKINSVRHTEVYDKHEDKQINVETKAESVAVTTATSTARGDTRQKECKSDRESKAVSSGKSNNVRKQIKTATDPSVSNTTGTYTHVIDEAFAAAAVSECSNIKISYKEVVMILEALGYLINNESLISATTQHDKSLLELPIANAASLAQVLSSFAREHGLVTTDSKPFAVSEVKSNLAIKHIKSLIYGPWNRARSLILQLTSTSNKDVSSNSSSSSNSSIASCRPSNWSCKQVRQLMSVLQLQDSFFSDVTGLQLLDINKLDLRSEYGINASILRARFVLYQQMLYLLDMWWLKDIRPSDSISVIAAGKGAANSSKNSKKTIQVINDKWGVFEGANQLVGEDLGGRIDVEISPFKQLVGAWIPLNRAYGWGIPMEQLNLLGSTVCNKHGYIHRRSSSSEASIDDDSEIKGCRWVTMYGIPTGSEVKTVIDNLFLQENFDNIGRYSFDHKTFAVLVPILCIRPCAGSGDSSSNGRLQYNTTCLCHIDDADIKLGMHVSVGAEAILRNACNRFDWWDRPTLPVLQKIHGKVGLIIATTELGNRRRVGVRISVDDGEDIIDALPIESLFEHHSNSTTPHQSEDSERCDPSGCEGGNAAGSDKPTKSRKKRGIKSGKAGAAKKSGKSKRDEPIVALLPDSASTGPSITSSRRTSTVSTTHAAAGGKTQSAAVATARLGGTHSVEVAVKSNATSPPKGECDTLLNSDPHRLARRDDDGVTEDLRVLRVGTTKPDLHMGGGSPSKRSLYRPASDDVSTSISNTLYRPTAVPIIDTGSNDRDTGYSMLNDSNDDDGDSGIFINNSRIGKNNSKPIMNLDDSFEVVNEGVGNISLLDYASTGTIRIPSPGGVDYSWMRQVPRQSIDVSSSRGVEMLVREDADGEEYDDCGNDTMQENLSLYVDETNITSPNRSPKVSLYNPTFDVENAKFDRGLFKPTVVGERYYDHELLTHQQLHARNDLPTTHKVRKKLDIASRTKAVNDNDYEDERVSKVEVSGGFTGIKGKGYSSNNRVSSEGTSTVPLFLPPSPYARSKQQKPEVLGYPKDKGAVGDHVIDVIDYKSGNFGIEGRNVRKKKEVDDYGSYYGSPTYIPPPPTTAAPVKTSEHSSKQRPKSAIYTRVEKVLNNQRVGAAQIDDQSNNAGVEVALKPSLRLRPSSAVASIARRAEMAQKIVDSMEATELANARRENVRASKDAQLQETYYNKQLSDISKM